MGRNHPFVHARLCMIFLIQGKKHAQSGIGCSKSACKDLKLNFFENHGRMEVKREFGFCNAFIYIDRQWAEIILLSMLGYV